MRKALFLAAAVGTFSAVAWALPWDTDMADSVYLRAFSWEMQTLPEGTISRNRSRLTGDRTGAHVDTMTAPESIDLADGKHMFDAYCTACHGADGQGKAPVTDNSSGARYPVPPPVLGGTGNITKRRSDGYLFYTIRDGSTEMPGYGYAMEDHDVWDVVAYMRTLDGTTYDAPAPEATTEEVQ